MSSRNRSRGSPGSEVSIEIGSKTVSPAARTQQDRITGTISSIDAQLDPTTHTLPVRVVIDDRSGISETGNVRDSALDLTGSSRGTSRKGNSPD